MVLLMGEGAKAQDINFCSFSLSEAILQAHTSFNVIYEFDVDKHGVPVNIKSVAKQFASPEMFKRVLRSVVCRSLLRRTW